MSMTSGGLERRWWLCCCLSETGSENTKPRTCQSNPKQDLAAKDLHGSYMPFTSCHGAWRDDASSEEEGEDVDDEGIVENPVKGYRPTVSPDVSESYLSGTRYDASDFE